MAEYLDNDAKWTDPRSSSVGYASPSAYSWHDLAEISDMAAENPENYWEWCGYIKSFVFKKLVVPVRLVHVQSGYGFVFEMLAGIDKEMNSTNSVDGGWRDCDMRQFLNEEYILEFPEELQALIKPVEVNTAITQTISGSGVSFYNMPKDFAVTQDKLWLPSRSQESGSPEMSDWKKEGESFIWYRSCVGDVDILAYQSGRGGLRYTKFEITENSLYNSVTPANGENSWTRSLANGQAVGTYYYCYPDTTRPAQSPNTKQLACPCFCITAKPQ